MAPMMVRWIHLVAVRASLMLMAKMMSWGYWTAKTTTMETEKALTMITMMAECWAHWR